MNCSLAARNAFASCVAMIVCLHLLSTETEQATVFAEEVSQSEPSSSKNVYAPETLREAKVRARILHETIHGSLQVMHRDFFNEEESISIPSHSLEDVFKELAKGFGVDIEWLAVNAKAMNVDNIASDEFQKEAVKVLSSGKEYYEKATDSRYHFAGAIHLQTQCLKCHLPSRSTNNVRTAALVISMPLKKKIVSKK